MRPVTMGIRILAMAAAQHVLWNRVGNVPLQGRAVPILMSVLKTPITAMRMRLVQTHRVLFLASVTAVIAAAVQTVPTSTNVRRTMATAEMQPTIVVPTTLELHQPAPISMNARRTMATAVMQPTIHAPTTMAPHRLALISTNA